MVTLIVTLAADGVCWADVRPLLRDGLLVHVEAVLNLRWDDFSALDLVREAGLHGVEWDPLNDDTPGSVTLTVLYRSLTCRDVETRWQELPRDTYDCDCTETVERQTAETDF